MVSDVYMICDAYESGVGWGKSGRAGCNPYPISGGNINAQCHEAWNHGYEFGLESIGLNQQDWYAKQRKQVELDYALEVAANANWSVDPNATSFLS